MDLRRLNCWRGRHTWYTEGRMCEVCGWPDVNRWRRYRAKLRRVREFLFDRPFCRRHPGRYPGADTRIALRELRRRGVINGWWQW